MQTTHERNGPQAEALDRLTRLQALTASLSEAVTCEQVAEVILAQAAVVLGTSTGVVARLSEDGREFVCLAATGYPEPLVESFRRFPADARMPLADAVRERRPVFLANLAERDAHYPDLARIAGIQIEGALVALPLVARGKAVGGIGLRFPTERVFPEQDRAFTLTIAGLCAQALDRAWLYDTERSARERAERAENELRESEERLRTLSDNLPLGAVYQGVIDRHGQRRCTYISAGVERLFGVTPAEVMADATVLYRLIHDNDQARIATQDEAAVQTLTPLDCEFRSWTRSGSLIWVHTRSASRRLANGETVWEGIVLDVTPRKRAEEELGRLATVSEKRRRLYEAALSNTPDLVYVFDLNHRFVYANEGLLRMWGKTWEESIGKNCLELGYEPWHAAMHDREIEQVVATRQPVKGEVPFTGTFGRRIYEYIFVPVIGENGEVEAVAGTTRDVTERRRAEAELSRLHAESDRLRRLYETALSNSPDYNFMFDLEARFTYANEALLALWGRSAHEAIGKNPLELGYPAELAERLLRQVRQAADTRLPVRDETLFTTAARTREFEYILVPVVGEGAVEAVVGSAHDITDRKALEGRLREQAERLLDADRRKDDFLATLAHELRNPLAPLRNGLELMKMASGDAGAIDQARRIMERQLAQMVRLIDDLLDVSRITSGKMHLRRELVDLATVVQSAVDSSRPLIEASGHRLIVSLPPEPVLLDADPTRLAQVFGNLLTNAAKYTDRGGRINLSIVRETSDVVVSIRDTGIGIASEHLPRLFERFSQVKSALERSQGGLGIGLSLVKGLVEMHGGTVDARSDGLGKGTEFIVRLPVQKELAAPSTPQRVDEQPGTQPRMRILVADDNRDAAESLAAMLRLGGHEVHAVHDGQEAVEAVGWFRPNLALLDIGMPKLNGYEVVRRIREQPWGKKMVLVAITGWGQEEDKRRAAEAGFDHHLTKPMNLGDLEKLLGSHTSATQTQ